MLLSSLWTQRFWYCSRRIAYCLSQLNFFSGKGMYFSLFSRATAVISSFLSQGVKKVVLPQITSGSEATWVVMSGVFIAKVSVWTDQNPSDKEGATTACTFATRALNSSLGNPFQIFTLPFCEGGKPARKVWIFSLIKVSLWAGIKLKISWSSGSCSKSSGIASTKVSIPLEMPVCPK